MGVRLSALATAVFLLIGPAVIAESGSEQLALASASGCEIAEDDELTARGFPTEQGYYAHEAWIANDKSQRIGRRAFGRFRDIVKDSGICASCGWLRACRA